MWRVMLPLVLVLMGPVEPQPDVLYVHHQYIYGLTSGKLWEGTSPTRCSDGSIVYVHEGDLWRDGVRIDVTVERESHPSCVEDVVYYADYYIWRLRDGEKERLFKGRDPSLAEDGRIAYRVSEGATDRIYVWDGATHTLIDYVDADSPSWGKDGRLYFNTTEWQKWQIGYWDGAIHWLGINGFQPCWTPQGLYYVTDEPGDTIYDSPVACLYHDGKRIVRDASHPAW